jgi:hypothetical protein
VLEVVEKVARVHDAETQADQILGQAALGAQSGGDGCVAERG